MTNTGTTPCLMPGHPTVALIDHRGHSLRITAATSTSKLPPITLRPSVSTDLVIIWSNWCAKAPGDLQVKLTLPGGAVAGPFDGPPNYNYVPPCLSPSQPSTLAISGYSSTKGLPAS